MDYSSFLWEKGHRITPEGNRYLLSTGEAKEILLLKNNTMDMCQGPLLKKIILYTIPIILTGVLQLLFNAADLVVVGRFCGSISVAAVGATGALINLIVNLFMGLSVGAGVTVAQSLGARNRDEVGRIVHTAIPVALCSGAEKDRVGELQGKLAQAAALFLAKQVEQ